MEFRLPNQPWTYVSSGVWAATQEDGVGLEFVCAAQRHDLRNAEIVASAAYYHAGPPEDRLGLGHTVPMGEPLAEGSECDHVLVSLPYPYGPKLENCEWDGGRAHLLWLLPITRAEREYKKANGLEALEVLFDQESFEHWNPHCPSVSDGRAASGAQTPAPASAGSRRRSRPNRRRRFPRLCE